MEYNIDNAELTATLTAVNLDAAVIGQAPLEVAIGKSARIDVGEAINYVKSGAAEIAAAVQEGTAAFDLNAEQKTADFNENASNKTTAFNENATIKQAAVDDSADAAAASAATAKQYAIGVPSEPSGYSAKYWAEQTEQSLSGLQSDVADIQAVIPASATASNKLTDKSYVDTGLTAKQNTLVSGINIKTVNNQSLLGSGNIDITASVLWGGIGGTLSNQTDLQNALNTKQDVISDLSTIRSGAAAGATAVQPADLAPYALSANLATVATSGSYNDLSNKPTIPAAQINSDWNATSGVAQILNKPDLSNYVTTNTTQTITGDKTFTNNFIHYKTDIAYTETPSVNKYGGFNFLDKNGTEIGAHYAALYSSGSGFSGFNLRNKSGNTATLGLRYNTSGTFYTEAPAPTDTTTTSGTQIATTGWVNSTDNNAVHKTGDETIAGKKTFSGNIKLAAQSGSPQSGLFISSDYTTYAVSVQDTKITKGTAPSSNSYCGIDFYGTATTNYANRLGLLEFRYETDKLTSASLCAFKSNTASDSVSARVAVYYPPTGNPYTEAPASDANNSIVTTVGKNKAQNGYFKLGNGLIIQWGRFTVASGKTSATITFPTAFTSTNYSINCMQNNKNGGYQYDGVTGVTSRNTANCTVYTFYDSTGYDWIAIGY